MLHALGLDLPKQVFGHGWLLMKDGKMSKSKGNVIYPETLVERYGLDAVRYYLLRAMPYGNDGIFTPEDFVDKVNFDLANDLGNLLNRTIAMINKYEGGLIIADNGETTEFDADLEQTAQAAITEFKDLMNQMHFSDALKAIWKLVSRANKYIDETQPWILAKDETKGAQLVDVMSHLAKSLRVIAGLLQPIMTKAPVEMMRQLGIEGDNLQISALEFNDFPTTAHVVAKGEPIFPRLDVEQEVAFIQGEMTKDEKKKGRAAMEAAKKEAQTKAEEATETDGKKPIRIEAFDKVEIKVAQIKAADHVEGADKLLKFQLDDGTAEGRQILSGIAKWYPEPEQLVGKKVLIVANLKPRKMRGELSQGMLLSAEHDGEVN
jgi:methionyl-tRNA synthetase C-terminal region/beta chain